MSVKSVIKDGGGSRALACVTSNGQLVTSPIKYDDTVFNELGEVNVAYNFYEAKAGKQFIITVIRAKANRLVSSTADASVVIYEATSDSTTTESKVLHQEAMVRGESVTISCNIAVNEGVYVNAKTDDDDIYMTIMGYYINTIK
jgi:hypothetical protein